jgi:16S rRNA (guanine1207-N2)-methyltransferase
MNDHYYSEKPTSESSPEKIEYRYLGKDFVFATDSGVFSKGKVDRGTDLLLESLEGVMSSSFLDMGCGYGPVGICYKSLHNNATVLLADINERACELARRNAIAAGVKVDVKHSDGFEAFSGMLFDCIAMNPPIRAGKAVLHKLMKDAHANLQKDGQLFVVIRTRQGAGSMRDYLEGLFGNTDEPERGSGYRVIRCIKR